MCIDSQMLSAYLDGELKEPYRTQVQEHLAHCEACQKQLDNMASLDEQVKAAKTSDEMLDRKKDIIFNTLDQKYFQNGKKVSFIRRKIEMRLPTMITAAAAVVFIFIGGFMFFGTNPSQTEDILPSFAISADQQNVRYVSSGKGSLDDYSLEEIMQYLDSKGYNVNITMKGLQPIETN